MKWRFVYPWHRRVTPSSSILILRLLSIGVFFPLSPPSSPRTFPQLPSPFHSSVSFSLSVAPLLPNVRSLSSRSSPSLHFSLSLSLSPHPHHCLVSLAKKFTFAKKREKDTKNRCTTPVGRSWLRSCPHSSAARSWAWLKDELSLCHRLY